LFLNGVIRAVNAPSSFAIFHPTPPEVSYSVINCTCSARQKP